MIEKPITSKDFTMPISLDFIMNELKAFYKLYLPFKNQHLLEKKEGSRNKKSKISDIKILAIMIMSHLYGSTNFKSFYELYLPKIFRKLPEYSWFMRLRERVIIDLICYLQFHCVSTGKCFFIDSTPMKVCHNKRIKGHKTFKGEAERGYHSMGWFYGFKLHMIINEKGEIARFCFTKGNVSDVNELKMAEGLNGILVGDKGYISQEWEKYLEEYGLKLITKRKKNMKPIKLNDLEKALLGRRNIIETVFSQFKNWGLVNTKIRSYCGWILNTLSTLATYVIQPFKPHVRLAKNLLIHN